MTRTAAEPRSPHTESTRVLLASPLAEVIAADLAGDHHVQVVRTPGDLASTVIGRLRHDVVVADLIWQHGDLVRSFDGLDVVAALSEVGREAPVLLGLSGIPAEQDHLAEGLTLPAVCGVIAKRSGLPRLRAAIDVLAQGGRDFDDCEPARSRLPAAPSIHQLFDASPPVRRGRGGHRQPPDDRLGRHRRSDGVCDPDGPVRAPALRRPDRGDG